VSCYRLIEAEKAHHGVSRLCRVLGVSRAGFYAWQGRPPSARAVADQVLTAQIRVIHQRSRGTYGAPRIHAELRLDHGVQVARKRVARLMGTAGLVGCHRRHRRGLTRRDPQAVPAPDLVGRAFTATAPNRVWTADITYVPTWSGWLYLAVVLDVYSRRVVGWAMADHLRTELVVDALDMAIWNRRPQPGLVHHSDQGCQYTSLAFGRRLRGAGLVASMGSVGDCYDTQPSPRASSPPWNVSCWTGPGSPPAARPARRSSTTWRASTTPAGGTPPWATSAPPTTRGGTPAATLPPDRASPKVSAGPGQLHNGGGAPVGRR
jgi:putative transposase